ncbi:MAG: LPS export ABC transporter permease LptF [Thermodesulfobacteriota bacterium]|nr:MAG: LPS export ABC transporter permease LptF [Thermodesulfobacteriota bacterium]
MPRLISRYILREITPPFLLSVVILTSTALLTRVVKLVELLLTHGLGPFFVFKFLVSVIPGFLIYTIPISFLIAVLVAFTRLSSDSEITAMKASGISLFTIMRPVLAATFITFAVTLAVTLYVFPWGNLNIKRLIIEAAGKNPTAGIEEKTFYDGFKDVVLYVDHVSEKSGDLEGVFITEKLASGASSVFFAEKGTFGSSREKHSLYIKLKDGTAHRFDGKKGVYHVAGFSTYVLELSLTGGAASGIINKTNRELYPGELAAKIRYIEKSGGDPGPYIIDFHKRFALPASIFVFALLGVPLGLQKIRSARLTGFSIALGVVLVYYVLSTALEGMGEVGLINPVFAVWGSDIIIGAGALYIFYVKARDKKIFYFIRRKKSRALSRDFS